MFTTELLDDRHHLDRFSSGNEELDGWLSASARRAAKEDAARTYVWANDADEVVAYFAVAPTGIVRTGLPGFLRRNAPDPVPAFLLAKLALDESLHGQDLGAVLLVSALELIVGASDEVAGRAVVVDAIDRDAVGFYERHGFRVLEDGGFRLAIKVSALRSILS